jgi:cysteine desulfurase / selenocysteine lyase
MIYLDNPATTNHKPLCVKLAVLKALSKKYSANPGRSSHKLSINAALKILEARELLKETFNLKTSDDVIFTSGCTESLNLAILGTAKQKGHIITTIYEHNSVLRPLFKLQKDGIIELTIVKPNKNHEITTKELKDALRPNTYLLAVNHTSNATGYTIDLDEMGKFAKQHNLLLLVDAAQSGGHIKIDMQKDNINLLALAGHKGFYAPQGVGALLVNNVNLQPIKYGGTGFKSELEISPIISPDVFEAGTTCTPLIFGFYAGIKYANKNMAKIKKKTKELTNFLVTELSKIKGVKLYTQKKYSSGVVSFNIKDLPSSQVANELCENYNICVRSGLHCAPLVHKHLGTIEQGMVRVGIALNTTKNELKKLIVAVKQILKNN